MLHYSFNSPCYFLRWQNYLSLFCIIKIIHVQYTKFFENNFFLYFCCYICFSILYTMLEKVKSDMEIFIANNQEFFMFMVMVTICLKVCSCFSVVVRIFIENSDRDVAFTWVFNQRTLQRSWAIFWKAWHAVSLLLLFILSWRYKI